MTQMRNFSQNRTSHSSVVLLSFVMSALHEDLLKHNAIIKAFEFNKLEEFGMKMHFSIMNFATRKLLVYYHRS